jgi:hypothetical protein
MGHDQDATRERPGTGAPPGRPELRADCGRCFALCCVAPAFSASAEFAFAKPAGQPCRNLAGDFGCSIHDRLRPSGFGGCASYDCFGAGQQVAQRTFGGRDWRNSPELAGPMFAAFAVMRQLHELLWYLRAALELPQPDSSSIELETAFSATKLLTDRSPQELVELDLDAHRGQVNSLLLRASEQARSRGGPPGPDLRGADLIGKNLDGADLRRASLRGALLVGASLRHAYLTGADLTGADVRGADLAGADLAATIFLTQAQLDSAAGDAETRLPAALDRPPHWELEPGDRVD